MKPPKTNGILYNGANIETLPGAKLVAPQCRPSLGHRQYVDERHDLGPHFGPNLSAHLPRFFVMAQQKTDDNPIRVVLVDDHFQIHKTVQAILRATPDIRLVGQGGNGREGIELCEHYQPDIVLMDVLMPVMDGIEATKTLHERLPEIKILVLSSFQDHESVYSMLRNGAVGYLTKGSLAEDLADTIRTTFQGKMVFSSDVGAHLLARPEPVVDFQLTDRELEVLVLLAEGLTNRQSALKLSISQSTLKFHMNNVYRKLGVQTRSEALVLAAKNNLV